MKGHTIVYGSGRMGRIICNELTLTMQEFVVIEKDPSKTAIIQDQKYLYIPWEIEEDELLIHAEIKNAKTFAVIPGLYSKLHYEINKGIFKEWELLTTYLNKIYVLNNA